MPPPTTRAKSGQPSHPVWPASRWMGRACWSGSLASGSLSENWKSGQVETWISKIEKWKNITVYICFSTFQLFHFSTSDTTFLLFYLTLGLFYFLLFTFPFKTRLFYFSSWHLDFSTFLLFYFRQDFSTFLFGTWTFLFFYFYVWRMVFLRFHFSTFLFASFLVDT